MYHFKTHKQPAAMFPLPSTVDSLAVDWQLDEFNLDELMSLYNSSPTQQNISNDNSTTSSPPIQDLDSQLMPNKNSNKRSNHNEYERERRKKLNSLYSSLQNLLPEKDQNKRLSIPCTIARVVKYIPELQKHIERLLRKKEETLQKISKVDEHSLNYNLIFNDGPVISVTCLDEKELTVQICIRNQNELMPMSTVVNVLEGEGLGIMNATSHTTCDDKIFYSFHLQAENGIRMEGQNYSSYLTSILKKQAKRNYRLL